MCAAGFIGLVDTAATTDAPTARSRALGGARASGRLRGWSPGALALVLLLVALIAPPLYYLVKTSLYTSEFDGSFGELTFAHYTELFSTPRFFEHFLNSAVFALGSGCLAIFMGAAQAWIVERTNTPLRNYAFGCAVVSLGIPHVLYTIAWLLILGKQGPVNMLWSRLSGAAQPLFNVNSMTGMILIEALVWTPLAFLMLSSVLRSFDASLEEAAMTSGASGWQTFTRVTLRLMTPSLLALFLLVCIRAFEAFDIPALVGSAGNVSVLSTDVFESIRKDLPPSYGQAGAFSVVLMAIVALLLRLHHRILRNAERFQTITGRGFRPRAVDIGGWRLATGAVLCVFFIVLIVMPLGMVLFASLLPFYDGVRVEAFSRLTLENYELVAASKSFRGAIFNTLVLGGSVATCVCLLTAAGAWLAVRKRKGGWLIDQLATLPLVFPAIVLGVAFLQLFVNAPIAIYGTLTSLVVAGIVQYLPYGMRFSCAGAIQISRELEEAGAMAGASNAAVFRRVVLPLMAPAVSTAWLFVMLLCVRAVGMPVLLAGPNAQVVAVTIFDLWSNGQTTHVAAIGLTWAALMMCVGVIFHRVARRNGLSVG